VASAKKAAENFFCVLLIPAAPEWAHLLRCLMTDQAG